MTTDVIPMNITSMNTVPVITGNVLQMVPCSIPVKRITTSTAKSSKKTVSSSSYDMRTQPTPKKVTQCTSGRKCTKVDYSQFELTDNPPIPPKKKRAIDLKRKPSASRIAAEKYKTKPANTRHPIRKAQSMLTPVTMVTTSAAHPPAIPSTSHTITMPATQQETSDVLNQLSTMDIVPDDDPDYDTILPITPQLP